MDTSGVCGKVSVWYTLNWLWTFLAFYYSEQTQWNSFKDWWTSIFWESKKLPVFLRSRPMDLFCPDTVNNFYYWKQDKISGRSRVGGCPPPLIFRPNWGLKKILCETTPPYVRVLMTRPPPLSEGLDPPLRIQATTLDRLLHTSYMWWMSQTEKTSFQFPS